METEDVYGTDAGSPEPCYMWPVLSTRRRLQNRVAQRRYREKAAKKRSREESLHAMDWASMSLGDLDCDAKFDHGGEDVEADLSWEQVWTIESASSSAPSSSSFSPPEGVLPSKDALLLADMDMMSRHGASAIDVEGKCPMPGHRHQPDMHHSPPSLLMALHQPPYTEDFLHQPPSPEQPILETGQTLELVQPLLHVAVRSCNRTITAMLLQRRAATVNDRNGNGTTALHIAAELGDDAIVSLLLDYGADSSARDAQGRDALYLAVSAGHTAIVELMLDKCRMASQVSCFSSR